MCVHDMICQGIYEWCDMTWFDMIYCYLCIHKVYMHIYIKKRYRSIDLDIVWYVCVYIHMLEC